MSDLRALLFGLLVVALLPWGAWVSAAAARAPQQPAVVAVQRGGPALLGTVHRCRTALLPGQNCGQEPALLPAAVSLPGARANPGHPPLAILMGAALLADTSTPPPKAV